MLSLSIPTEIKPAYDELTKAYKNYKRAENDYLLSKIPRYVSIPQFFDELGLMPSYQEMKQLAKLAEQKSREQFKMVKVGTTEIGHLFCYLEEVLDSCFDEMTLEH